MVAGTREVSTGAQNVPSVWTVARGGATCKHNTKHAARSKTRERTYLCRRLQSRVQVAMESSREYPACVNNNNPWQGRQCGRNLVAGERGSLVSPPPPPRFVSHGPVAGCLRAAARAEQRETARAGAARCLSPTGDGVRLAAPVEHVGLFQ